MFFKFSKQYCFEYKHPMRTIIVLWIFVIWTWAEPQSRARSGPKIECKILLIFPWYSQVPNTSNVTIIYNLAKGTPLRPYQGVTIINFWHFWPPLLLLGSLHLLIFCPIYPSLLLIQPSLLQKLYAFILHCCVRVEKIYLPP